MKTRIMAVMAAVCLTMAGVAHAELKDNGDGTITDTAQNLVWLKNANCFGSQGWNNAMSIAAGLSPGQCGLSNNPAGKGSWRLPTKEELQVRAGNKAGFTNVQSTGYWSSSTYAGDSTLAVYVYVGNVATGYVFYGSKGFSEYVWPVRSGQ